MNLCLAVETSGPLGSVALGHEDASPKEWVLEERSRHGELLGPTTKALLAEFGACAADLEGIVVGLGPGSYTGVRIGVTYAKTLAALLNVPLVGLSGLMALASQAHARTGARLVAVAEGGHAGRVYGAVYRCGEGLPSVARAVGLWDRAELVQGFGENLLQIGAELSGPAERVSAATFVNLARTHFRAGGRGADPKTLEPLYLQPPAPERPTSSIPGPS